MPVVLRGWNDFYEGWLSGLFGQGIPLDGRFGAYLEGREMGADTQWDEQLRFAIEQEIECGHISVFEIPEDELNATTKAALGGAGPELPPVEELEKPETRRRRRETDDEAEARLKTELLKALEAYVEHVRTSS